MQGQVYQDVDRVWYSCAGCTLTCGSNCDKFVVSAGCSTFHIRSIHLNKQRRQAGLCACKAVVVDESVVQTSSSSTKVWHLLAGIVGTKRVEPIEAWWTAWDACNNRTDLLRDGSGSSAGDADRVWSIHLTYRSWTRSWSVVASFVILGINIRRTNRDTIFVSIINIPSSTVRLTN